jgi:hypothetical protein
MSRLALLAALTWLSSCSTHQSSALLSGRTAVFLERTSDGYERVMWFPDDDCEIRVAHGPNLNEMDGPPSRHCTDEELAQGEELLNFEAWETYPDVSFEYIPLEPPASDKNSAPQTEEGYNLGGPYSTVDYPVGIIELEQSDSSLVRTKHFQAGTTGPEAEVIEYFRGLAKKYGAK